MKSVINTLLLMVAIGVPATSQAILIDQTITLGDAEIDNGAHPVDPLTIQFTGLPSAASAATITFSVRGDFFASEEWIDVSVDGFSFGRWLDNDLGNDTITGPTNDAGNDYNSILTGTSTIALASLNTLLGDGILNFQYDYQVGGATDVDNLGTGDLASVRIQYEAAVPEPVTLVLMGLGLAGIGYRQQRSMIAA